MQKTISLRQDVYDKLNATFDDFENGMYMSCADLIDVLIKEHKEYKKIKDGVN
jgi:predicted CopG family antitoxin